MAKHYYPTIFYRGEKYFHTVKYAAKKVGLTIKQVAELLGAPYRTVQNWFNGTHQPSPWIERLVVEKIYNSV